MLISCLTDVDEAGETVIAGGAGRAPNVIVPLWWKSERLNKLKRFKTKRGGGKEVGKEIEKEKNQNQRDTREINKNKRRNTEWEVGRERDRGGVR